MKLHLGCGTKKLEGWVNIDSVKSVNPDLLHDITQPLPYLDQSVDEVLAEDLLEHFDKYIRFIVFYEWVRVLKIDGRITVRVPNLKKILLRYFKFGYDKIVDSIFGECLWDENTYIGHFGSHKWGYSQKTLAQFVQAFGVEPITIEKKDLNIILVGRKEKHYSMEDLKDLDVNAFLNLKNQRNTITFRRINEKIDDFYKNL